jgi:hypothetical protein
MEFWDRERDVLLKEQVLEHDKMTEIIKSKDLALEKLSSSLQSKDEALEGFVIAQKSQTSTFKLKNDQYKSISQQANRVVRTTIPELRLLRNELQQQRQSIVDVSSSCQRDTATLLSCVARLSQQMLMQAALNSKLERMFEVATDVACDASCLFAKSILATEE